MALDLARYGDLFAKTRLPEGAVLVMSDRNHVRLYRYPDSAQYEGTAERSSIIKLMSALPAEGVFAAADSKGMRRLYSYKRFYLKGNTTPYLYMRVSIPEEKAFALARKAIFVNVILLFSAFFVALLSAWFIGNIMITRRLNKLVNASERLGGGDLTARTGISHNDSEIGQLASAFDKMGDSLIEREAEKKIAMAALQENEEWHRQIAKCVPDLIWTMDLTGRITYASVVSHKQLELSFPSFETVKSWIQTESLP